MRNNADWKYREVAENYLNSMRVDHLMMIDDFLKTFDKIIKNPKKYFSEDFGTNIISNKDDFPELFENLRKRQPEVFKKILSESCKGGDFSADYDITALLKYQLLTLTPDRKTNYMTLLAQGIENVFENVYKEHGGMERLAKDFVCTMEDYMETLMQVTSHGDSLIKDYIHVPMFLEAFVKASKHEPYCLVEADFTPILNNIKKYIMTQSYGKVFIKDTNLEEDMFGVLVRNSYIN